MIRPPPRSTTQTAAAKQSRHCASVQEASSWYVEMYAAGESSRARRRTSLRISQSSVATTSTSKTQVLLPTVSAMTTQTSGHPCRSGRSDRQGWEGWRSAGPSHSRPQGHAVVRRPARGLRSGTRFPGPGHLWQRAGDVLGDLPVLVVEAIVAGAPVNPLSARCFSTASTPRVCGSAGFRTVEPIRMTWPPRSRRSGSPLRTHGDNYAAAAASVSSEEVGWSWGKARVRMTLATAKKAATRRPRSKPDSSACCWVAPLVSSFVV